MRRRTLGFVLPLALALTFLGTTVPALAATEDTVPNAIAFWNSHHGLAGGGYPYFNSPGKISMTTDGGRTFRTVLNTDGGVVWLDTAGTEDAWAVVQANSEDRYLLHTGDGGITWHQVLPYVRTETPGFGSSLIGLGVTTGSYAPAGGTRFIATSDGGATWKRRASPCPKETENALATLASPKRAWAVCGLEAGTGAQAKMLYRSTDGGHHWQRLVNVKFGDCDAGMCSLGYPEGLSFARGGFGFMWQGDEWGYLTRSGGKHWKLARQAGFVGSASVVSDHQGFVLTYKRRRHSLLRTKDAGRSWAEVHHWSRRQSG